MRKIISKIAGTLLGLSLAMGVGVSLVSRKTSEVTAAESESIVFKDLGLTNGVKYSDPFDGGNFTITFAGGDNDGKYYTTGSGIRTYGGGYFTVASDSDMSEIAFVWDGSNAPSSDVASPSGYSSSTNKWIGNAKSVVFTRPSGSGHWRLKSVTVTYSGGTVIVTHDVHFYDGDSLLSDLSTVVQDGTAVSKPADPSKGGFTFVGWFTDKTTLTDEYDFSSLISGDLDLYAKWSENVTPSGETLVITADYIGLDTTGFTNTTASFEKDNITYQLGSGGNYAVKATAINASTSTNAFSKTEKPILMGKNGAYIYNSVGFDYPIKSFKVYSNYGASTSVIVGAEFGTSAVTSNTISDGQKKTMSVANKVYDYTYTDMSAGYTFFRVQVCSAHNAQIQIEIVFDTEGESKTITDTRLDTSSGTISAKLSATSWTVTGFVFEVQYDNESTWNAVEPSYVISESVPTSIESIGNYAIHFKVTYKGVDYYENTSFTATVLDNMTPISLFHTDQLDVNETYTYRGTVIGIEGNSYYLQQDQAGILIYGGTTQPPTGMVVGDLVSLTSKVQNYKGNVIENNGGANTAAILGKGSLPAAPIVTTVAGFNAHPQSTRVTFNGLSRNDTGDTITWSGTWASKSSDQSATVKDSSGATITLYVSRYLDETTATAIISKINTITVNDTFDLFQGVKVVSSSDGSARLSIMSADQVTIHTPESDPVQDWIDLYMEMNNPAFDGDGTGACNSDNYYVNAKSALDAVETAHPGSKASFQSEDKYADALARYLAWAKACGDKSPFVGTEIVTSGSNTYEIGSANSNASTIIIVVVALTSITSIGVLLVIKRKRSLVK